MPNGFAAAAPLPANDQAAALRQIVTGNRLRDGVPVYFTATGDWTTAIGDAVHVPAAAAETLLQEAQAWSKAGQAHPVVAPYLIEVALGAHSLIPVTLRERIRAFGPSVGFDAG